MQAADLIKECFEDLVPGSVMIDSYNCVKDRLLKVPDELAEQLPKKTPKHLREKIRLEAAIMVEDLLNEMLDGMLNVLENHGQGDPNDN